jgi:hypothetical protein
MLIAPFPVTHRTSTKNTGKSSWLLTFTFSARADPALLSGQA